MDWRNGLLAIGACAALAAQAAPPLASPGDRDLQRERQEQLLREQRQRLEELQQLPGKTPSEAPTTTAPDTRCFTIRTITLEGAEHLDERAREALLAPYRNRCLGVGRDISISAGRDITSVTSRIDATRDIGLSAGRDVTLASAADEQHSYSHTKKITAQEDHVSQRGTELNAGGDVLIHAGQDITLKASKIGAGDEAYLVAGDKIEVLAANDSDYSLFDKKSKGSFGQKKIRCLRCLAQRLPARRTRIRCSSGPW